MVKIRWRGTKCTGKLLRRLALCSGAAPARHPVAQALAHKYLQMQSFCCIRSSCRATLLRAV